MHFVVSAWADIKSPDVSRYLHSGGGEEHSAAESQVR